MTICKYYQPNSALTGTGIVLDVGADESGQWLVLDETCFHVKGGGQKPDIGDINRIPVTNVVRSTEGIIKHYLSSDIAVTKGQTINQSVNEKERNVNSAWHTAGHLVANICDSLIDGLCVQRSHQYPFEAWVGGTCPALTIDTNDLVDSINAEIAIAVANNLPVAIHNGETRMIEIGGFDPIPCGGTHLTSTGSLTTLKVTKLKRKSGNLKISYTL